MLGQASLVLCRRAFAALPAAAARVRGLSTAASLMTTQEVKKLFSIEARLQSWLDVEAHMAQAQGGVGIIPKEAAAEIARAAMSIRKYDLASLSADMRQTHSPVLSLVRVLADHCKGSAGSYVHWGATTENIILAGLLLQTRRAHSEILGQLAACLEAAKTLADEPPGQERVCVGRTVQRQAVPTTWGFRFAVFIEELSRHGERLLEAEQRLFRLCFGGALGAFHSLDGDPSTSEELGKRLGMMPHPVQVRSSYDCFSEYLMHLGLLSSTVTRIAGELYSLMGEEIGEVKEVLEKGMVGSSTMAAKINPKYAPSVLAFAGQVRAACVLPALEIMRPLHEGDPTCSVRVHRTVTEALPLAHKMLAELTLMLRHIEPDEEALQRNLRLSEPGTRHPNSREDTAPGAGGGSLLCTENAVMRLGAATADRPPGMGGRQWAFEVVSKAAKQAVQEHITLFDALMGDPLVRTAVPKAELRAMLQPENYLGASAAVARSAVALADDSAARLRAAAGKAKAAHERVQVIKYRLGYTLRNGHSLNTPGSCSLDSTCSYSDPRVLEEFTI